MYKGEYDEGLPLLKLFCLLGSLQLVSTIPLSLLSARMSQQVLARYVRLNLGIALPGILVLYVLATEWGLRGILWTMVLLWALRCVIGYALVLANHSELGPKETGPSSSVLAKESVA